jgi:hypothetical protein
MVAILISPNNQKKQHQAKERLQFGHKHFEQPLIIIVAISKASTNSQFS